MAGTGSFADSFEAHGLIFVLTDFLYPESDDRFLVWRNANRAWLVERAANLLRCNPNASPTYIGRWQSIVDGSFFEDPTAGLLLVP